jgi:Spy/CpxP family protein refolding chaperone
MMKRFTTVSLVTIALSLMAGVVSGQGLRGRADGSDGDAPSVSPLEIQRMFDAYALLQAQEQLKITDDQYAQFLPRFKALQDARRKAMQERVRIVQDLRRLTSEEQIDEAQTKERLKALQEADARSESDIRRAYEAIDQVLDMRQRAKFRIFEEMMERRKLELVVRARQANRQRSR